jgi:hypothetical protein
MKFKKNLKFNIVLTKKLVKATNTIRLKISKITLRINKKFAVIFVLGRNIKKLK